MGKKARIPVLKEKHSRNTISLHVKNLQGGHSTRGGKNFELDLCLLKTDGVRTYRFGQLSKKPGKGPWGGGGGEGGGGGRLGGWGGGGGGGGRAFLRCKRRLRKKLEGPKKDPFFGNLKDLGKQEGVSRPRSGGVLSNMFSRGQGKDWKVAKSK